jgi:hypothetical protein
MTPRRAWIAATALAVWAVSIAPLGAQNYRVRLDARGQAVSFRDLVVDSVLASTVVTGPTGGLVTPDGYAVRCSGGSYCYFTRPGDALRGIPVSTSASVILWGLGVPGLTINATGRLVADLGPDDVWPATDPAGQLIEGYVEYRRPAIIARGGRLLLASRLEPLGFDGASVGGRFREGSIEVTGYGGWGLARAAVLPITNPALNPLDEFRPAKRQIVLGAEAAWRSSIYDARAEYRREVDPQDHNIVSERTALSVGAQLAPFHVSGSIDYNIAEALVGSADLVVTYIQPRFTVTGGARRYKPFFSLWSLFSAFSPVPYNAVNASADFKATRRLTLHGRGELYHYQNAEVSTALVPDLEEAGWRSSGGGTLTLNPQWSVDGNLGFEHGPGAASRFADGALRWSPNAKYAFDVHGGALDRPLELRFYDATSLWVGARGERQFGSDYRLWAEAQVVHDERDRPDPGASSLSQFRIRTGVSASFGTSADRLPLPPARPTRR